MPLTLYGIPNCDTVKKARTWLDSRKIAYHFHDYKKQGIDAASLKRWQILVGTPVILNQRGTTWRKLADADKAGLTDTKAIALMQANPSLIKRPVVEGAKQLLVGFSPDDWDKVLG